MLDTGEYTDIHRIFKTQALSPGVPITAVAGTKRIRATETSVDRVKRCCYRVQGGQSGPGGREGGKAGRSKSALRKEVGRKIPQKVNLERQLFASHTQARGSLEGGVP